jgi:hypothetical protein
MASILLDAYSIACPQAGWFDCQANFKEKIISYVQTLVEWDSLRNFKSVQFTTDNDLTAALADENCYPMWDSLTTALNDADLSDDFQIQDVNTIIQSLLQKSVYIEDVAKISDLLIDSFAIANDCINPRRPRFQDHLSRMLAFKAVMERADKESTKTMKMATVGDDENAGVVQLIVNVAMCEWEDGQVEEALGNIATEIECFEGAADFYKRFDPFLWWENGSQEGCRDALVACIAKSSDTPCEAATAMQHSFVFGKIFLDSARNLGFIHDKTRADRVMRACKEVLLKEKLASTHHLRVNKGPQAMPHQRENYIAWRKDIDHDFHLHYWDDGKKIEFANVVVHNDFSITR